MIEFPEDIKNRAFVRSGLKCECTSLSCGHVQKCSRALYRGNWRAVFIKHPAAGGDISISNCEIVCDSCYGNHQMENENQHIHKISYG